MSKENLQLKEVLSFKEKLKLRKMAKDYKKWLKIRYLLRNQREDEIKEKDKQWYLATPVKFGEPAFRFGLSAVEEKFFSGLL